MWGVMLVIKTCKSFNEAVTEGDVDELLKVTQKICYYKLQKRNVKMPTFISKEDVVQDCMIKVYQALDKFDSSKASANTYFTRIIERVIIDSIRYYQAKERLKDEYNDFVIDTYCGNISSSSESDRDSLINLNDDMLMQKVTDYDWDEDLLFRDVLNNLSDMLSERERKILILRYNGYTHQEVADILGLSRATIAKEWRRVRKLVLEYFS